MSQKFLAFFPHPGYHCQALLTFFRRPSLKSFCASALSESLVRLSTPFMCAYPCLNQIHVMLIFSVQHSVWHIVGPQHLLVE